VKNILVTGANGQLGSEIQKLANEYNKFAFMFTDAEDLDITEPQALTDLKKTNKFDFIINCAAYTAVDKAEEDISTATKINQTAVKNLVTFANQQNAFLLHVSTDFVFDGKKNVPYIESDPCKPVSAYGQTKYNGELEALEYERTIVIRTSWLYSLHGNNFVKTMLRLGQEKESLGVVYDQTGAPTFAGDLAKAILDIITISIEKGNMPSGLYHYSNAGVASWYDFAHAIMQIKQLKCKIKPILTHEYPTPAKRPAFSVLNCKKIKSTFNLEIPHWQDSLNKCLNQL